MKNYKPVRLVNPTAILHTQRVFPCQRIELKLKAPHYFLPASEESEFNVMLFSEFLELEHDDSDHLGNMVYTLVPKYDLSAWQDYGEVLLGEIIITIDNNHNPKTEKWKCTILVIQKGNSKVLTVVNPADHTVKLEPHQLLEVVCFETSWNDWQHRDYWEYEIAGTGLTKVRYEWIGNNFSERSDSIYPIKSRHNLKINPRLTPKLKTKVSAELAERKKPTFEHHWWYVPDKIKNNNMEKGWYDLCKINTAGSCIDRTGKKLSSWHSLDVKLLIRGRNRMNPYYATSTEHKFEVTKRSEVNDILTNPQSTELVDFFDKNSEKIIEIVQPNAYWNHLEEGTRWHFILDNTLSNYLEMSILEDIKRWGKTFQRIKVKTTYKDFGVRKHLGAIRIICEPVKDAHDSTKKLIFWTAMAKKESSCIYTPTVIPKSKLQICDVILEEVYADTKDSHGIGLVAGVSFKRFSEFGNTNFHHQYEQWNGIVKPAKKKEMPGLPIYPQGKSKVGSVGRIASIGSTDTTSTTAHNTFFNPDDGHSITFCQSDKIEIRMSSPKILFKGEENELWSLETDIKINKFVTHSDHQIVTIEGKNLPPFSGTHELGKLKFSCSKETRVIKVRCEVDRPDVINDRVAYGYPMNIKVFPSGNSMCVMDWNHNDAFMLDPEVNLQVASPVKSSGFDRETWRLQLQQLTLPESVWRHPLLKEVIKYIDIDNPWLLTKPTGFPFLYYFHPLVRQQPYISTIIRAASEILQTDSVPIAKLIFRNDSHVENTKVDTPYGIMEARHSVEKVLYLCLPLKRDKYIKTWYNPKEEEQIEVSKDIVLYVKMQEVEKELERGGYRKFSWTLRHFPVYLFDVGSAPSENGVNVFKFRVRDLDTEANTIDKIQFECQDITRTVYVKYKKNETDTSQS